MIEYFYSAHSAFAYIGSKRVQTLAKTHGLPLRHRLIHLSPVMEASGSMPFAKRTKAHKEYFFETEVNRWAAHRNVPVVDFRPTHHDADYTLAGCLILAAQEAGLDADRLSHGILEIHWRDDADLSDETVLVNLVISQGLDAKRLLNEARSKPIQHLYEANTREAIERSVFGSPTYFVNGEMFYGQDRLELMDGLLRSPPK
ncbi:MAG: 2-hydroxychromene-2-carboxylate isomerase [Pseudomonadota bacterium]